MDNIVQMMMGAAGAAVAPDGTDPFFNQTTLLLHGDGTNGAQNNTFLDSSSNNFTITRNGNTTQGTFSPFSLPNGQWSVNFKRASSNDRLLAASNAGLGLASANFCIELWAYFASAITGDAPFTTNITSGGFVADTFWFGPHSENSGKVTVYIYNQSAVSPFISESTNPPVNEWVHYAFVRNGNNFNIYRNGVSTASSTFAGAVTGASSSLFIGRSGDAGANSGAFDGYLSNLRVVNGSSVYTAAFTPPTTPLTNITNTKLLTLQSNRFVDNSSSPIAVTVNAGNPSVQPFSPFLPSAEYDPSVNGGSGYFDGSGDYLTAPDDNFWDLTSSTGSIEMFLYSTTTQTNGNGLVGQNSASGDWGSYVYADGKIGIGIQGTSEVATASGNLVNNAWIHVVFTRDNSTGRTRIFVNGVLKATGTGTYFANSANPLQISRFNDGLNRHFIGYMADIRFCKGSIPTTYQTASTSIDASIFTPPTAPLTVSSQGATSGDTELLLNFTNAGIFDNTGKNNLETVGDAQIDTSVKKYGTGSMEFDGNGDYLKIPSTNLWDFGTGNFTVEFWVNFTSVGSDTIIGKWGSGAGTYAWVIQVRQSTNHLIFYTGNNGTLGTEITFSWTPNTGTWYHVAVTRSGTNLKAFVDGTQIGSTITNSDSLSSAAGLCAIGENLDGGGQSAFLDGFLDDLRITKGIARYTANFTPPSQAFPNL